MSPFKSAKQRRFMFARMPRMAKKWASKYGGKIRRGKGSGKQGGRGR